MRRDEPLILILYNDDAAVTHGEAADLIAVQYTTKVAERIEQALSARGHRVQLLAVHDSLDELRQSLEPFPRERTFIFNNCDSFGGDNKAATLVMGVAEAMGFRHTGSLAATNLLCIDKRKTKEILTAAGIPTPRGQVYSRPSSTFRYRFPAIVKPVNEDASMGIELQSVVTNTQELRSRLTYLIQRYAQPALVEEFIEGRELAVSLWGNEELEALPVVEQDYSEIANPLQQLLTFESKWVEDSFYYQHIPAICPAPLEPEEHQTVVETAMRTFRAMGLRDFGRVDMRFRDGVAYVIDVNEIPDLDPESGFARSARAAGYTYEETIERLLVLALKREGMYHERNKG